MKEPPPDFASSCLFFNPQKERKFFEIKDAINEVLVILRKVIELENIHIQIDVPINYKVIGVLNELSQVIINLIQNSKDAFVQNGITNRTIIITLKQLFRSAHMRSFLFIKGSH